MNFLWLTYNCKIKVDLCGKNSFLSEFKSSKKDPFSSLMYFILVGRVESHSDLYIHKVWAKWKGAHPNWLNFRCAKNVISGIVIWDSVNLVSKYYVGFLFYIHFDWHWLWSHPNKPDCWVLNGHKNLWLMWLSQSVYYLGTSEELRHPSYCVVIPSLWKVH